MFTFSSPINAHTGHDQTSSVARYEVSDTNESAIYTWYDSTGSYNYTVDNGSQIEVEIAEPTETASAMNITIGNLTRINITDTIADASLAIGYWNISDSFGFISDKNWSDLSTKFGNQNFISSNIDTDTTYQFGAGSFDAVNISFADGFQTTNLVYDADTGLLYHAYTTFGNYILEFDITDYISVGDDPTDTEDTPIQFIIFASTLLVALPLIRRID